MMQNTGVMTLVAYQFLLSSSVSSYFLYGAGSLVLADQPGWVGRDVRSRARRESTAAAARRRLRRRRDRRGGFDGGGFGGGFDGGGFGGGGFDGGGG